MDFKRASGRRLFLKRSSVLILSSALPFKIKNFMDPKGVIVRASSHTVKETMEQLVLFLEQHGVTIYARINQQAEAEKAGVTIQPLEFILFGNPKVGGPVILENPVAALDLPLKIIVWEDKEHKVWYAFNDAQYLQERYALPQVLASTLDLNMVIAKALAF